MTMRLRAGFAVLVLCLFASTNAIARDGDPDATFGGGDGKATYAIDIAQPLTDRAIGTMPLPDGRMLVVGTVTPPGPDGAKIACMRIAANGDVDTTYAQAGYRTLDTPFNGGSPGFVSAFGDGFVLWGTRAYPLAAGDAPAPDGNTANADVLVMQVRTDCTVDTSFGDGGSKRIAFDVGGANQDVATAAFIGDVPLRIFIAAAVDASANPTDKDFGIAVLTLAGQLDTSFSLDGKAVVFFDVDSAATDVPSSIHARGNKVLVAGRVRLTGDVSELAMTRLTTTGIADSTLCPTPASCPGSLVSGSKRTYGRGAPGATDEFSVVATIGFDGAIYTASSSATVSPPGAEFLLLAKFGDDGAAAATWGAGTGSSVGQLLANTRPVFIGLTNTGLVVAGSTASNSFSETDSQSRMFIARFLPTTGQGDLGFASTNNCLLTICATFDFVGQAGQPVDARAVHVREIDGRYVLTGSRLWSSAAGLDYDFALVRTQGERFFRDSFE